MYKSSQYLILLKPNKKTPYVRGIIILHTLTQFILFHLIFELAYNSE